MFSNRCRLERHCRWPCKNVRRVLINVWQASACRLLCLLFVYSGDKRSLQRSTNKNNQIVGAEMMQSTWSRMAGLGVTLVLLVLAGCGDDADTRQSGNTTTESAQDVVIPEDAPSMSEAGETLAADLDEKTALGVLEYTFTPIGQANCADERCLYEFVVTFTRTEKQLPTDERRAVRQDDPLNPELMMHFHQPGYEHKVRMALSYVRAEDDWTLAGKHGEPAE